MSRGPANSGETDGGSSNRRLIDASRANDRGGAVSAEGLGAAAGVAAVGRIPYGRIESRRGDPSCAPNNIADGTALLAPSATARNRGRCRPGRCWPCRTPPRRHFAAPHRAYAPCAACVHVGRACSPVLRHAGTREGPSSTAGPSTFERFSDAGGRSLRGNRTAQSREADRRKRLRGCCHSGSSRHRGSELGTNRTGSIR